MKKYFPIAAVGALGLGLVMSIIVSQQTTKLKQHASTGLVGLLGLISPAITRSISPPITSFPQASPTCTPIVPTCFPGVICPRYVICGHPTPTPVGCPPCPFGTICSQNLVCVKVTPTPSPTNSVPSNTPVPITGTGPTNTPVPDNSTPTLPAPTCCVPGQPCPQNNVCQQLTPTQSLPTPTNQPTPIQSGPTNTPVPLPSPTPVPGASTASIQVSFSVLGIPDQSNTAIPLHATRTGSIDFVDSNNNVTPINTTFTFDNTQNAFTANIVASVLPGIYLPKIDVPGYLHKALQLITIGQTTATPNSFTATVVNGDIDADNTIDILDFQHLFDCYNKTVATNPKCAPADLNDDGKIDAVDFNIFLRSFSTQHGD